MTSPLSLMFDDDDTLLSAVVNHTLVVSLVTSHT